MLCLKGKLMLKRIRMAILASKFKQDLSKSSETMYQIFSTTINLLMLERTSLERLPLRVLSKLKLTLQKL